MTVQIFLAEDNQGVVHFIIGAEEQEDRENPNSIKFKLDAERDLTSRLHKATINDFKGAFMKIQHKFAD